MEYTVVIVVRTPQPLAEIQIARASELGGVASVNGDLLTVTFTQGGSDPSGTVGWALSRLRTAVGFFLFVSIEVMTTEEADRRLAGIGG